MGADRAMTAKLHLSDGKTTTFQIIAPHGSAPEKLDGKAVSQGELDGTFQLRATTDPTGQTFDYDLLVN